MTTSESRGRSSQSESGDADADTLLVDMDGEVVDIDPTDHCSWWVLSNCTARSSGGRVVHLPNAIAVEDEDATDPDPAKKPDAETLCYLTRRTDSEWKVKSHAVLPPGFRDVCRRCATELKEVVDDE